MKAHHLLLSLWCLALLPAAVQAEAPPPVEFRQAWIREAPPASPVMAGYVRIENTGRRELTVLRVESPAFGAAEIHEMRTVDGMMRMRPLPDLRIEPGAGIDLAPGGTHLMLFRPVRELKAGEHVSIDFVLADDDRRTVDFEVRPAAPAAE